MRCFGLVVVYCTSPFLFKQLQITWVWLGHIISRRQKHLWLLLAFKVLTKLFFFVDKMTNQITPLSSALCPNKAWGKRFILKPVQLKPAIFDYKIHKYNKITIYTRLALQTIKNQYVHRRLWGQRLRTSSVQKLLCPVLTICTTWGQAAEAANVCGR